MSKIVCDGECIGCPVDAACDHKPREEAEDIDFEKLPCKCESPAAPEEGCQYHDAKRRVRGLTRNSYKMKY
jgi:hypothetical protein